MSERDEMSFDVVVVGAGPAGLAAACHVMQLSAAKNKEKRKRIKLGVQDHA